MSQSGDETDQSAAQATSGPRRASRRASVAPGKIIVLAVAANLLIAGGVSAAVAPVETSGAALSFYDSWPDWLRTLFGDRDDGEEGSARGWLGSWLDGFHTNAIRGDPKAQLRMELELDGDLETMEWVANETVHVSWVNYGAPLSYHVAATASEQPPDLQEAGVTTTMVPEAEVELEPGTNWVHVQAQHKGKTGPVATMGPFWSDPDPPAPPTWAAVDDAGVTTGNVQVDSYQFTLGWNEAEARSGITAYHLERRTGGGDWVQIATIDPENTSHQERNRPNGAYGYRLLAESGAGLVSAPGDVLNLVVDAQGSLTPPGVGAWHYGVSAVYDSLIHVWDISDPSSYSTVDEIRGGQAGLTQQQYEQYTKSGWGITTDNATLRSLVAQQLGATDQGDRLAGGERNALSIGLTLFEWMFNEVDYDFEKFAGTSFDLLQANQVLDAGGGICGDLTALFVTLMRIAGVPARPVHGYLINEGGAGDQEFDRIGGFHMWPEIYVGGDAVNGPGGGWIPVDVSGVTGPFKPELLHVYVGVANPNYLQLGVQRDLGTLGGDPESPENRWNVWANLRHWSYGGADVTFSAETAIDELDHEQGDLWFTPGTNERVWCPKGDEACRGDHNRYFQDFKGRSVRSIDYGADISWTGDVHELKLTMRYPLEVGPTQVMMWTAYERDPHCQASESDPRKTGVDSNTGAQDFLEWTISGSEEPCSR